MSRYLPILLGVVLALVTGCVGATPPPTPVPPAATLPLLTATPVPPTATATLSPTNTPTPTNTPKPTATLLPPLSGSGGGVIAFVSERDGDQEIYIMNADGSDQRRLTNDPSANGWPNWSPDGKQMAFQSNRSGALNIYVMDVLGGSQADESKVSQLTNSLPGRGGSWEPAWSPDGKWIVYSAQQTSGSDIFLVNLDGTGRQRLTENKAIDGCPTWSPDGKQIAFFSDRDGNWEIYVTLAPHASAGVNADGSNVRRLTNHPGQDHSPAWSPDGARIAFVSERDGNEEIYLMNPDGANLRRLTHNKAEDWFPAWSPDGKRIVFSSNRDSNHEIYVMNADGSDQKRLTNNNAEDWGPVWQPKSP
jgi:Tol biopolymer transport system component